MPPQKKTAKKKPAKKAAPKADTHALIPEQLAPLVIRLRHENVILDSDIAELYGVETKALNRAVKRNAARFPSDFMFQLSQDEYQNLKCQTGTSSGEHDILKSQPATSSSQAANLKSQSVISSSHGGRRTLPYAFTEQGVAMLSSVLRSPRAVEVNIAIMRTFVQLRSLMQSNKLLAEKNRKPRKEIRSELPNRLRRHQTTHHRRPEIHQRTRLPHHQQIITPNLPPRPSATSASPR